MVREVFGHDTANWYKATMSADHRPEPSVHPSIDVLKVSYREFCDHLGIDDEKRFRGVQVMPQSKMIWVLLERLNDADHRNI